MTEITFEEVPQEVVTLRDEVKRKDGAIAALHVASDTAREFARQIGAKLKEHAEDNELCDEYEKFLKSGFSDIVKSSQFYEEFIEAARRDLEVERTFTLNATVYITPDDYEYDSLSFRDSMSVEGTYKVPKGLDIDSLDDLDDDRVEHVSGTNLREWYDGLDEMDVTVEASEDDLSSND